MKIGVPKEIKNNENRVALTPAGVTELVARGHLVQIQTGAGENAGYYDKDYVQEGAIIVENPQQVFANNDLILKVKEPQPEEYGLIREGQVLFTYFHLAASKSLTEAMQQSGAVCIAYETIEDREGGLPLLMPMSQVAGRLSVQEGARFLMRSSGGSGKLLGGVPGVKPAVVMVLGGGVVGTEAAKMAAGLGAQVQLFDINPSRLSALDNMMPANVQTVYSNRFNIKEGLQEADLVIGAVLIPGAKAPSLVQKADLKLMKTGSVIVDVAVDQGGCIETMRPTSYDQPVFEVDNIIHYGVANMPGAVPHTSTQALTNATLPYILKLASEGWEKYAESHQGFKRGLNVVNGQLVHPAVIDAFE